jgi:hypothetical protein
LQLNISFVSGGVMPEEAVNGEQFIDIDIFINCNWVCHPVAVNIYTRTLHRTTQITTKQH